MKEKIIAISMAFVMLISGISISPNFITNEAKAAEVSGLWTDFAQEYQTEDKNGQTLGDAKESPILIESEEQLAYLAKTINEGTRDANVSKGKYYKLTRNLDLSGKYWTAIGIAGQEFQGAFDGNGKVIQGLTIDETQTKKTAGLFGDVYAATENGGCIENLTVLGADIQGTFCDMSSGGSGNPNISSTGYGAILAASLTGDVDNKRKAKVTNCHVQGKLKFSGDWSENGGGETAVGGISGYVTYAKIDDSSADIDIYGDGRLGGFVAVAGTSSEISNCRASGVVNGGWGVGGFVGEAWEQMKFTSCYANVTVKAYDWHAGGFAGYADEMPVFENCVAAGNVESSCVNDNGYWETVSGGFIGGSVAEIVNCYALGKVSFVNAQYPAGAFMGANVDSDYTTEHGSVKDSYCRSDENLSAVVSDKNTENVRIETKTLAELSQTLHKNIGHGYKILLKNVKLSVGCKEGYTGDVVCEDDGEIFKSGENYAMKEHTWDKGEITTQPEVGKEGEKTYHCTECDAEKKETIEALKPTATPTATPIVTPTATPTTVPTIVPTQKPTVKPTTKPTVIPTKTPIATETQKKSKTVSVSEKLIEPVKAEKTSNQLYWNPVKGADGYFIYASLCNEGGKQRKMAKISDIKNNTVTSYVHKNCKKNTWYKYRIVAYQKRGKKKVEIQKSLELHSLTKGSKKYANPSSVKIQGKKNLRIKEGSTKKIRAQVILPKGKKTKKHIAQIRYIVEDKSLLTVTKKGKIKAKKAGSTVIYVIAQNGVNAKIKVKIV